MKNKIYSIISILALACGFAACDDHTYGNEPNEQGSISFANFGIEVEKSESAIESRAAVDVSDFLVKIVNSKNEIIINKTYGELPGVLSLPVGDYSISVESHEVKKAEWDKPYYKGATSVSVSANRISEAKKVICNFSSVRVTIKYSDKLKAVLGDDVTVNVRVNDNGELDYTKDETRSGYFEAVDGSMTLVAIFRGTVSGNPAQYFRKELTDVKAGQHRIITFKIQGPEPPEENGSMDPSQGVTIDTSVETIDQDGNINIDGEDVVDDGNKRPGSDEEPDPDKDPDNPTPPTGGQIEITSDDINFDKINPITGSSYVVKIKTENKLAHVKVKIISNYLTEEFLEGVGMKTEFDLAEPGDLEAALVGFELPIKDDVIGKNELDFDLTMLIPLLKLDPDKGQHTFELTVVDDKGNTEIKTLKFQS